MAMVDIGHIAAYTGGLNGQVGWLGRRVGGRADEPGELLQWL